MKNEISRNEKILAIVIIVAVVFLGIYKIFFDKDVITEEKIDTETITLLKNNSKFYTVSSCVSKYLSYLSSNDNEKILILLSNNYKKENSIDINNIDNYITKINSNTAFIPRKIFEQRMAKSIYKYYVSGYIQEETIDSASLKQEYYLIVILNEENMTFEIEPYDGSMFK